MIDFNKVQIQGYAHPNGDQLVRAQIMIRMETKVPRDVVMKIPGGWAAGKPTIERQLKQKLWELVYGDLLPPVRHMYAVGLKLADESAYDPSAKEVESRNRRIEELHGAAQFIEKCLQAKGCLDAAASGPKKVVQGCQHCSHPVKHGEDTVHVCCFCGTEVDESTPSGSVFHGPHAGEGENNGKV